MNLAPFHPPQQCASQANIQTMLAAAKHQNLLYKEERKKEGNQEKEINQLINILVYRLQKSIYT